MSTYDDITLVSGATTITLPKEMEWIDRRSRNLVTQNIEMATNGAPIIEEFQQLGAYPITLVAKGDQDTWVDLDQIESLQTLADAPLTSPMTLTYNDGTVLSVRFLYDGTSPAVQATPVLAMFPESDSPIGFALTLKLIQASA